MKRIVLTPVIEGYARNFLADLRTMNNKPEDNLLWLKNELSCNNDYSKYVNEILLHYSDIITATPDDIRNKVVSWFSKYKLDLTKMFTLVVQQNNGHTRNKSMKFYQWIVYAMCYDKVQEQLFPKYIKKMGIKCCVYCNAQYAISAKRGITSRGKTYRSTFTIDHYLPKSLYPYLATSYYNLYPVCSTCNQTKNAKDPLQNTLFELYITPLQPKILRNPFEFKLDKQSFVKYSLTGNAEDLVIKFETKQGLPNGSMNAKTYENEYHIEKLYLNYSDSIEEVIWKHRVYNKAGCQALEDSFSCLLPHKNNWNRFVLGNYDNEDDIHKRPLAKLIQDVAKQLGII